MAALSERERLIYSIVESHTRGDPKGYCTQRELVDEVNASMPGELQWNDSPKSHDHCFPVWSAVRAINASPEVDKIVIVDNFRYYLATKEEAKAYIEELKEDAMRKLKRASDVIRKYRMDGQGDLEGNFREAFV